MARVIVSAGHTDELPGTVVGDLREVDIARKLAKLVVSNLRTNGVITLSVPYNLTVEQRIKWVNTTGYKKESGDVFIELHSNKGGKSGVEAWYFNTENKANKRFAETLLTTIENKTGLKSQGAKDQKDHEIGEIKILKDIFPYSTLLECLYLDNKKDQEFLKSDEKLGLLAGAIANGICAYIGVEYKTQAEVSELKMRKLSFDKKDNNKQQPAQPKISPAPKQPAVGPAPAPKSTAPAPQKAPSMPAPSAVSDFKGFDNNSFDPIGDDTAASDFGSGASAFSGFNAPTPSGFGGANKPAMTRDERKDMVKKWYQKGFGKDPEQSDLNYFLNIGISEEQMLKRILESQDHLDQMQKAAKFDEVNDKYEELKVKAQDFEKKLVDQREIMEKLNSLLLQKNAALAELQKRILYLTNKLEELQINRSSETVKLDYKGGFWEQLFDWFSRKLS